MLSFIEWAPVFICCTIVRCTTHHCLYFRVLHKLSWGGGGVHFHHQKKGSHFINELKGWWVSAAFSIFFFFLIHPFMFGDSPPSSSTAPSGLSCCCNVVVVYHWTSDANLCFALALCPLFVGCCLHPLRPSLPHIPTLSLSVPSLSSSDL